MKITALASLATLVVATLPATLAGPASASDNDVVRRGACSEGADWKLKAKPDDGRIEVEAEVDSNVSGQDWRWVLRREGKVAARGTSTTHGASGSFSVNRRTGNAAGRDSLRFRATDTGSGQVCVGRLTL